MQTEMAGRRIDDRFGSLADIREMTFSKQKDRLAAVLPKSDQHFD
jgi:hypothetical protein